MLKENSGQNLPSRPRNADQSEHSSPIRLFIIIIASIFIAEVFAMIMVYLIPPLPYYITTLVDAGIMVILIFPILYVFSFHPLIEQIEKLQQAELVLQQEQELQERFFNSVDIMIAYMDRNFNFIRVNDAYARNSEGRSPEYFTRKNHFFLYPNLENQKIFERVVETGEAYYAHEKAFGYPDEPERGVTYWNWSLQPVRDGNGNVEGVVLSLVDVTIKKRAEDQLREMALFPALNPNAALQVDGDGRIRKANSAAQQMGLGESICLFEAIPDLKGLDLSACIAASSTLQVDEARLGEQILQWMVRGVSELNLAFCYSNDITARRRSEEAVHLLSSVVEQTADTVVITNPAGVIEYVNPAFEQLTGYQKEDAVGQTPRVLKSGIHDLQFYKKLWDTVQSGQAFHSEITNRKKNSDLFHEVKTITPLRNGKGEITHYVATGKDITERKQAEQRLREAYDDLEVRVQERTEELRIANSELEDEIHVRRQAEAALQQSEERLKRAQEIAHLGSWELDLLNDRLTWSDEVYRIFGLQPDEFAATYEAFLEAIYPDDRAVVNDAYSGSIRDGKDSYEIEHRVVKWSTGEIRVVHEKCEHFRDETGNIIRSVGMVHDITERKKAEAALRLAHDQLEVRVHERTEELANANRELFNEIQERLEVERQLRIQTTAMESAANGIIITDSNGMILWTNPAVTQMTGYSYEELVGQSTRIFNSGKQDQDFYYLLWNTILAGKVWHGETTNRRKNGSLYVEEQTITPMRNEEGPVTHFIAIKQDVTERKLIYAQLEESNRELTAISNAERQQRLLAEGLVESSVALNMNLELNTVLDHIFEQTQRTIPYLWADIVLIESGKANVVRQWGLKGHSSAMATSGDESLAHYPIWERIYATKSAVTIPDTNMIGPWNDYLARMGIRSYLGAPLIYNDQVIGIINLTSDQSNTFHKDMANSLRAFAAPAAVAIQNARLYETELQNRKIAEILSAASVALVKTLDIQMVMETILDYVQSILPCDIAFVILSEGDERYRIRAVRASGNTAAVQEALQDQIIDMLNEPVASAYIQRSDSTFIPDSREIKAWKPPAVLASMTCWLGVPLESMGKLIGIVAMAHASPNSFTRNQIQLIEAVIKQAVVALQNAWLFEQVRSGRERLQQLSRHLVEIQENERKYIARELHDETSQSLTSLKLGLQLIEQKAAGHKQLLEQVKKLQLLADETLESLHHLAVNLRPASLDHLSLADALTGLIESTRQRSGLTAHFKVMGSLQPDALLSEELETSIYRIVQESLTNVVRHAHAEYVDVILEWQRDKIVIIIEDDGVGIDMEKAREAGHLGLIGMQERAEMLGGKLVVDSAPQVGTTLVVEIPYVHSNTYSR